MSDFNGRALIQDAMRAAFPLAEARVAEFYGMQEYHLGWRNATLAPASGDPGKLLRPIMALAAARAAGGDPLLALPLAAGIQLLHDFSLIHDDIEDDSDMRRGRQTLWTIWGLAQGINAGDGMFVIAHLSVHRLADVGLPAERVLAILRRFSETILTICEGQYLDISFEGRLSVSQDDYLAMIRRKTAVLVGAAAELGGVAGGADRATAAALWTFGVSLGLAFQVQDDVLGVWGDPERTGKPFAADLYRRKLSLPVIYGMASPDYGARLAELYGAAPDDRAVGEMLQLLDAAGARAATEAVATSYHHEAMAALGAVRGDPSSIAALGALAEGLLGRSR